MASHVLGAIGARLGAGRGLWSFVAFLFPTLAVVRDDSVALAMLLFEDVAIVPIIFALGAMAPYANQEGMSGITNTLPGRLERVKGELAPQVSRLLAGE